MFFIYTECHQCKMQKWTDLWMQLCAKGARLWARNTLHQNFFFLKPQVIYIIGSVLTCTSILIRHYRCFEAILTPKWPKNLIFDQKIAVLAFFWAVHVSVLFGKERAFGPSYKVMVICCLFLLFGIVCLFVCFSKAFWPQNDQKI